MSEQTAAARTPGAKRAGPGEYVFDLGRINHIKGGPDYSSVEGGVVEGDRMIVALMRMPAGTGAEAHSHPNEQWIYILEGTFKARIGDDEVEAKAGLGRLRAVERRSFGQSDPGSRRGVLHGEGRLAQSARGESVIMSSGRNTMKRIGLDHRGAGVPRRRRYCVQHARASLGRRTNTRSSR